MRAMSKLPNSEKEQMLPIVLLAPWLNSIDFDNTHKVILKSIGKSEIIVDLDRYFQSGSDLPSRRYFRELLQGDTGASEWMSLVEAHENYIPTIQFLGVSDRGIEDQVERARALSRGFVFRIDPLTRTDIARIFSCVNQYKDDDILTIVDFGYRDDLLSTAADVSSIVRYLVEISDSLRIVVTGSSFPNNFFDYDDFSALKEISERGVFSEIVKNFGNYQIFYGDWSSTKPRRYDGGGSRPLPRIDFPTKSAWIIARSKEEQWSFQDAADRITRLPEWERRPIVWGAGMIQRTALGLPGSISTGPEAIAARVNMHLYVQNHFADRSTPPIPEGEWVDPI
jgi:hypothetical protein